MIKAAMRFSFLLLLCLLLVYTPEIFAAISAPYASVSDDRVLLRIVLCCDQDTASGLQTIIHAFQKEHPHVHLRISSISAEQLLSLHPPYPDLIFSSTALQDFSPPGFTCAMLPDGLFCAASLTSDIAAEFTAYIDERNAPSQAQSQI